MNSAALATTKPKWWRWQPVTPMETLFYLVVMAGISGLISVVLNGVLTGGSDWGHFVSGAILSVVLNGITLWIKRHPRHGPHHGHGPD